MKRPEFTPTEEKLIDLIRNQEKSAAQVWWFYGPLVVLATLLFVVGLCRSNLESELTGYTIVLFSSFVLLPTKQNLAGG